MTVTIGYANCDDAWCLLHRPDEAHRFRGCAVTAGGTAQERECSTCGEQLIAIARRVAVVR